MNASARLAGCPDRIMLHAEGTHESNGGFRIVDQPADVIGRDKPEWDRDRI